MHISAPFEHAPYTGTSMTSWPELISYRDTTGVLISHLSRTSKHLLRTTSCISRPIINATVSKASISSPEDLRDLDQLKLHERFPQLSSIVLKDSTTSPQVTSISSFALQTLSQLPSLTSLDLASCKALPAADAAQALSHCLQLQDLALPEGTRISTSDLHHLAALTSLTHLAIKHCTGVTPQGLHHLRHLTNLRSLTLRSTGFLTDAKLSSLALLTGLTALDLQGCFASKLSSLQQLSSLTALRDLDISYARQAATCTWLPSLAGLQALTTLQRLSLPKLGSQTPQQLSMLAALTALTACKVQARLDTAFCALLQLPQLAQLSAYDIDAEPAVLSSLQQCSALTSLELYRASGVKLEEVVRAVPCLRQLTLASSGYLPADHELYRCRDHAALACAIAQQRSLMRLDLSEWKGLQGDDVLVMLHGLQQLACLAVRFGPGASCSRATCEALAALPGLQELTLVQLHEPQEVAGLVAACRGVRELAVVYDEGTGAGQWLGVGVMEALLAQQGMERVRFVNCSGAVDPRQLCVMAARQDVELVLE